MVRRFRCRSGAGPLTNGIWKHYQSYLIFPEFISAVVENAVENVYSRRWQMNLRHPKSVLSDALDLMVKAGWIKEYGPTAKGFGVDWTDRGKLAMVALGYVIEDLGPENFNQQLCWAVGTLANMEFTSRN